MCISCLQDLLKNKEKKSEPEKAQQDTVVATEHLPKENMIIAMLNSLRIQLELHMKIGIQVFRVSFVGLLGIFKFFQPVLTSLCDNGADCTFSIVHLIQLYAWCLLYIRTYPALTMS